MIFDKIQFSHHISWLFHNNDRFFSATKALIQSLIDTRQLNLRMLLNYPELNVPDKHFGRNKEFFQRISDSPIVVLFYLLKNFYGSFETLHSKLEYLEGNLGPTNLTDNTGDLYFIAQSAGMNRLIISYCLPFLLPGEIAFKNSGTENQTYYSAKYDCTLHFNNFPNSFEAFKNFQKATKGDSATSEEMTLNPYQIILDVFDSCKKLAAFQ